MATVANLPVAVVHQVQVGLPASLHDWVSIGKLWMAAGLLWLWLKILDLGVGLEEPQSVF